MKKPKRKKLHHATTGFIDLPGDLIKTQRFIQGARVSLLARLPNGQVKVRLMEDRGSYSAGRQITLVAGAFVTKQPLGGGDRSY